MAHKNDYNIVYITDKNYLYPTTVSIKSVIKSSKNNQVTVFVLGVDIDEDDKDLLEKLSTNDIKVTVLIYENELINIGESHQYVSKASLYKFKLAEIFCDISTVLYLDSDIIVRDDFLSIFDHDINDYYMAAVRDMSAELILGRDNFHGHKKYYNSGVMLLNLKRIRDDKCCERMIDYKKNDNNKLFMDQDAINAILGENALEVSMVYNYIKKNENTFSLERIAEFYNLSLEEFKKYQEKILIVHMASNYKPWKSAMSESSGIWLSELNDKEVIQTIINYFCTGDFRKELSKNQQSINDGLQYLENRIIQQEERITQINEENIRLKELTAKLNEQIVQQNAVSNNLQDQLTNLIHTVNYYQNRTLFGAIKRVIEKLRGK